MFLDAAECQDGGAPRYAHEGRTTDLELAKVESGRLARLDGSSGM